MAVAAGAAVVLWALAGAPGVVLAIALGTVIVVRALGAVLLPRLVREHSLAIAAVAGLVVLLGQSRWWAIVLTVGLAVAVLALSQRARLRVLALLAGAVLVVCGATGWVVDAVTAKARLDANYRAAGDVARGQMLPHQSDEVPGDDDPGLPDSNAGQGWLVVWSDGWLAGRALASSAGVRRGGVRMRRVSRDPRW